MFSSNASNGPVLGSGSITAADATTNPTSPAAGSSVSMVCAGCGAVLLCVAPNVAYVGVTIIAEVFNGVRWTTVPLVSVSGQDAPLSRVLVDSSTNAYYVPCIGASSMRVRATARTSGTVTVDMSGTPTPMCMMPDATLRAGEYLTEGFQATQPTWYGGSTGALTYVKTHRGVSHVAKASPGRLYRYRATVLPTAATGAFFMLFNLTAVPANGTAPDRIPIWVPIGGYADICPFGGDYYATGISACFSTTDATKTLVTVATTDFSIDTWVSP